MTDYNWKKAEVIKVGVRGNKPKITLRKSGGVHLNSAFIRDKNLQNMEYVKALIIKDEKKIAIGLIFSDKKTENSLKLAFGKDKKNAGFSGRSIFTEAGFDYKKKAPLHFEPKTEDYEGGKIFVIELLKKD